MGEGEKNERVEDEGEEKERVKGERRVVDEERTHMT